jgi:cytochrome P450
MSTQPAGAAAVTAELRSYPFPVPVPDPFQLPVEFAELRASEPVVRVRVGTGDEVWLVTRYEDVRAVLADRRFSRNVFRPDAARLIPGVPTRQVSSPFVDPPAHTRWRKLVSRAFTPRHVEGMRGQVQAIVDDLLDRLEAHGWPADLVPEYAYPLPIRVICTLFGIADDQHEPFRELADTGLTINERPAEEKAAAFAGMAGFSHDLIAAKRQRPGDDLLSQLVAVHDEDDGRLSEEELVATILAMLVGGYESTVNQIGKGLLALFRCPEQLAALRANAGLIGPAVEEMLRYAALDSGFGSPRYAKEDVPVGGTVIPKGSTVLVIRQSADRDETQFDDPERFDIRREPQQHNAFGYGPHRCLGAALARLQLELGIGSLLRRFPRLQLAAAPDRIGWDYRITAAGPRELPVTW